MVRCVFQPKVGESRTGTLGYQALLDAEGLSWILRTTESDPGTQLRETGRAEFESLPSLRARPPERSGS